MYCCGIYDEKLKEYYQQLAEDFKSRLENA